jgi:hypothetical protein
VFIALVPLPGDVFMTIKRQSGVCQTLVIAARRARICGNRACKVPENR